MSAVEGGYVGKDVLVEFAIKKASETPVSADWKILGMMRGKSIKTSWDTVDATADKSADATKETLVTFKTVEFSGDGTSRDEAIHNQELLEGHVVNPGAATNNRPVVHFRISYPSGRKYQGPFIVTEWSNDAPYSDVCTWSISATSAGAVVLTPTPVTP